MSCGGIFFAVVAFDVKYLYTYASQFFFRLFSVVCCIPVNSTPREVFDLSNEKYKEKEENEFDRRKLNLQLTIGAPWNE